MTFLPSLIRRAATPSLLLLSSLLAACGGGGDPVQPTCTVSAVAVSPSTANVFVGATTTLSATPTAQNCSPVPTASWSSSAPGVASVSTSGVVTAIAAGTTTITATVGSASATATITVTLAPVNTVTITPSALALLAAATSTPTVVLKAADNSVLTGRTVAWTTSNAAVATVNPTTGLITAVAIGTATITATSEGVAGTLSVAVVPTLESNRYANIWANQPSVALNTPYTPSTTYSVNAAGGDNTVTRSGVGTYSVVLGKLAKAGSSLNRENFFVTAYGSSGEYCRIGSWGDVNTVDMTVSVFCFDITGAPANSYFDLAMIGSNTLTGSYGFFWNSSAGGNATAGNYSFTTGSTAMTSTRSGVGAYTTNVGFTTTNKTVAIVSSYADNSSCAIDSWTINTGQVVTKCNAVGTTNPLDSRATVMLLEGGRTGKRWGYAWANQPSPALNTPYAPNALQQNSSSGQTITVTRTAVGIYTVTFPGLGTTTFGGTMLASIYSNGGTPSGLCEVGGWGNSGSDLQVTVYCFNLNTASRADQYFTILAIE